MWDSLWLSAIASLVEAILYLNSADILQHNMRDLLKTIPTLSHKLPGVLAKLQCYNRQANLANCLFFCRLSNKCVIKCDSVVVLLQQQLLTQIKQEK